MLIKKITIAFLALFIFKSLHAQEAEQELSVIPKPAEITKKEGNFLLTESAYILAKTDHSRKSADIFNNFLLKLHGFTLPVSALEQDRPSISLSVLPEKNETDESYHLEVNQDNITISGSEKGIFYGLQTSLQLINKIDGTCLIPAV